MDYTVLGVARSRTSSSSTSNSSTCLPLSLIREGLEDALWTSWTLVCVVGNKGVGSTSGWLFGKPPVPRSWVWLFPPQSP